MAFFDKYVFDTKTAASAFIAVVNAGEQYDGDTATWAVPEKAANGKWTVPADDTAAKYATADMQPKNIAMPAPDFSQLITE